MNVGVVVRELNFKAVRSSGAGGQHVNKVATKVEVSFHVNNSLGLTAQEKELLLHRLKNRISSEGWLVLSCSESRSQHRNKDLAIKKMISLLRANLIVAKKRIPTKPSKKALLKRLQNKKRLSEKKNNRKKPNLD